MRLDRMSIDTDIRVGDASYGIEEALAQREAALVVMASGVRYCELAA